MKKTWLDLTQMLGKLKTELYPSEILRKLFDMEFTYKHGISRHIYLVAHFQNGWIFREFYSGL